MGEQEELELHVGQSIGVHYVLERALGQGGFGQVWLARDQRTRGRVAIKIATGSYALDSSWYEAQVMRRIEQPGVAQLFDEGRDLLLGLSFIVMNVVDGLPFPGVDRDKEGGAMVTWHELAPSVVRLCETLDAMHRRGFLHLDLKPDNVLVDAESKEVTVLDFGLSRQLLQEPASGGSIAGTRGYISPEQLRRQRASSASDVYALGVMIYEALTGRLPRDASVTLRQQLRALMRSSVTPPSELGALLDPLPARVEEILLRALSVEPDHRPGSFAEIAEAFTVELSTRPHLDAEPEVKQSASAWLALLRGQFGEELDHIAMSTWSVRVTALHQALDTRWFVKLLQRHDPSLSVLHFSSRARSPFASLHELVELVCRGRGDDAMWEEYDALCTSAPLDEVRKSARQILEAGSSGKARECVVMEQWQCDAWSWRALTTLRCGQVRLCHTSEEGADEGASFLTFERAQLEALFRGPELWLKLRSRAASVLHEQTRGELFSAWRAIEEWSRLEIIEGVDGLADGRGWYLLNERSVRRLERGARGAWEGELLLPEAFLEEPICREILAWGIISKGKLTWQACRAFAQERLECALWELDAWQEVLRDAGVLVVGERTCRLFVEPIFSLLEVWSSEEIEAHHVLVARALDVKDPSRVTHLMLGRSYGEALDEGEAFVERLNAHGATFDAIDVLREALLCTRHVPSGDERARHLLGRWASLAILSESPSRIEEFLIAVKRFERLGVEDIVELVTLIRTQLRRSNNTFDAEYLRAHLSEPFDHPDLELCRLQLFYRAMISSSDERARFLQEIKPWFSAQSDAIRLIHRTWEAGRLRDGGHYIESAREFERVLAERKRAGLPFDALWSARSVISLRMNALDYEGALRCFEENTEALDHVQGLLVLMWRYERRRLAYLLKEPLKPMMEIAELLPLMGSVTSEAMVHTFEGAIAWRVGAVEQAQYHTARAQLLWRNDGRNEGVEMLMYALSRLVGGERWLDFQGFIDRVHALRWPRLAVQACGLWALGAQDTHEKETLRHIVTQRLEEIPEEVHRLRLEVLSIEEALDALDMNR